MHIDISLVISVVGFFISCVMMAGGYYTFKGIVETSMTTIKEELKDQRDDIEELKKADIDHIKEINAMQKEILKMISEINTNVAVTNKSLDVLNVISDIFGTATKNSR